MADYWKSQPRKYCEACKCWFGDNRASIDFHERGKRHKDNVQRQLREARNKTTEIEKEKSKTASALQAIELAAMKAYHRDLEVQVGLPFTQEAKLPPQENELPQQEEVQIHIQKQADICRSLLRTSTIPTSTIVDPPSPPPTVAPPPPPSPWQQLISPEGYTYYNNFITGVSQWECPPDFQQCQPDASSSAPVATATEGASTSSATVTTEGENTNTATTTTAEERPLKRSADEAGLVEREAYRPPKVSAGPYGGWTTVAVRPQDTNKDKEEEAGGDNKDDRETDKRDSESSEDEDTGTSEKRVKYFQEKTLPSSSGTVTTGSFKGFGFKKRVGGGAQKRPQIRQRTSEL